jgi:hypothetical protein
MAKHLTFIVSGGRTGTQFLGDLLSNAIEDCFSEHEPDIFRGLERQTWSRLKRFGLWQMILGRMLGVTGVRVLGTRYLTGKSDFEKTSVRLRNQRRNYHDSIPQGLLIESYYAWWMVSPRLTEIFPTANVIGIVRDPRHWIASWSAKSSNRGEGHWTHMLPPGPINPITLHDQHWSKRWDRMSDVTKLAWHWSTINRTIVEAESHGLAKIFRFEDIFNENSSGFAALCHEAATFDECSYKVQYPRSLLTDKRNASDAALDAWKMWSKTDREMINEICGPLMEKFSYPSL